MTSNCDNLDDWIAVMFRSAKPAHKEAIRLRTAEVQPIEDSLRQWYRTKRVELVPAEPDELRGG